MTNYASLLLNKAYLIIENEGEEISLVQILMETSNCVLIEIHDDEEKIKHTTEGRTINDELQKSFHFQQFVSEIVWLLIDHD